ncbi:hypothetical protein GM415_12470 [Pseudodesulfovibrio cashew]|uniref:Permease n=1 Tax=Pseudodesulfovibrio cashew TaxID=2678688 RepID=A0A6I6JI90_9BACT|nr:hypothetical protein [Pseudodesulfovibrio cashew]QGY40909.1 hypothetical protein GM415_12470 [Pseudodesulfovibrio cashew]
MSQSTRSSKPLRVLKPWFFPLACAALYGVAFLVDPDMTADALRACGRIFTQLWLPFCVALPMMILLNRYLSPSLASRLLGRESGPKGVLLSTVAGILSMGPIYAWYPLFKSLKDKGASSFNVANFMCARSIKPVLVPVLVGYFGWKMTGIFLFMNLAGAFLTAICVALLCPFGGHGEQSPHGSPGRSARHT